jgi:hypothetical protein
MINDVTPPPQPDNIAQDDITQPADAISQHLEGAADGITSVADNLDQIVEKGLSQAEEKLDGFLNGLDNFLGKF